jgi:O-antigen/teichoic acid export membrane protein
LKTDLDPPAASRRTALRPPEAASAPPLPEAAPPAQARPEAAAGLFSHDRLDRTMGMYLPATAAVRLINFARILVLTWWMSQQQFGLLTMILLAIHVLTPLCSLGLNEAVTRYVPQHETKGSLQAFLGRSFLLLAGITGLSVALICAYAGPLGDFFYTYAAIKEQFREDAPELARVTAVVTGLVIAYFYLLAVFKGLRMFRAVAAMELVNAMLFLGGSIAAMATAHRSALTLTAIYGLSLAVPVAWFGVRFAGAVRGWTGQSSRPAEERWVGRLLRFSVWTTMAGITWQVLMYYPAWYLNKVSGHEAVAVFSAVRQIGQFILIGAVAVVTVVMTLVTRTWETQGRLEAERQLSFAFRGTGLALLLLCGGLALCKDMIIRMFRPEYAAGAGILPLHLLFFLIGAYLAFLPIHFQLIEKTRHLFWPWAFGVAGNVLYAIWLTGPRLEQVREMAAWQWASARLSGVFATGFSDPRGLDSATWCGVLAIATALLMCVVLVRAECTRLDRGTYIILGSAGLLAMNPWILGLGLAGLMVVVLRTEWVFSRPERRRLRDYVVGTLRHLPSVGLSGRANGGGDASA